MARYQVRPGDYDMPDEWKIVDTETTLWPPESGIVHKLIVDGADCIKGHLVATVICDLFNEGRTEPLSREEARELYLRYGPTPAVRRQVVEPVGEDHVCDRPAGQHFADGHVWECPRCHRVWTACFEPDGFVWRSPFELQQRKMQAEISALWDREGHGLTREERLWLVDRFISPFHDAKAVTVLEALRAGYERGRRGGPA